MLEDNFCDDCYFYLITVYTGMIRHGGTRSTIEFSITGEEADSGIRVLTDGVRKVYIILHTHTHTSVHSTFTKHKKPSQIIVARKQLVWGFFAFVCRQLIGLTM